MTPFAERWFETPSGLRLFYRDYGRACGAPTPVVCLPGLTRTSRDFAGLAEALAGERRMICPDMRGRGRSDHDPEPANYSPQVEAGDVIALLDAVGVERAAFVGTSRGGLLTMLIAAARPELVAAAALNDIGPEIERAGLRRIAESLGGGAETHPDWASATAAQRAAHVAQFPRLTEAEWEVFARTSFIERDGRLARDYDLRLMEGVRAAMDAPAPDLWPLFDMLAQRPLATIRGANSDILSAETLAEMERRAPRMRAVTVADRGHCPFLDEPEALDAIRAVLREADE